MKDNAEYRYGSASFATYRDFKRAGMFKQEKNSLLIGFYGKNPLWYSGDGGWLICGGARSGKLRDLLAYNICAGIYSPSSVVLDPKGEATYIAQNQTADGKFQINWNPASLHNLPAHRINPIGYLNTGNPKLSSDAQMFCQNFLPMSKGSNAEYFDARAQEFLEGIVRTAVKLYGTLNFPNLYAIINTIPGNSDAWLDFAFEMKKSGFPLSKRIEEEIANSRSDTTGGFTGILGVIFKGFACLSDENLLASVSPPFDFDLEDMCSSTQPVQLSLMPPAEFIDGWASAIKAIFVALFVYKSRNPQSPQQTWFLDECAQLGSFPLLIKMFTYGAGIGARPVCVFQSPKQMNDIAPNAENIITASAELRSYFGVRDLDTATTVSKMIGAETLEYRDEVQVAQAKHAKRQAILAMMNSDDPMQAVANFTHHKRDAEQVRVMRRDLIEPNEVLQMPSDKQVFFTDVLSKPAYVDRKPYYEQKWMAGRFHPNPYRPPLDKVRVKTFWGHAWRKVIYEPVPDQYADYPQYADGYWSRIET